MKDIIVENAPPNPPGVGRAFGCRKGGRGRRAGWVGARGPNGYRGYRTRSPMKPLLKAVLIYENFAAGLRARWFCERLAGALDCTLEEEMWNFEVLRIREDRNAAASAARKADVVVISVSGRTELPRAIRAWLDMWLWLLEKENPALVGLFDSSVPRHVGSIRSYLSSIARRAGIDFRPHEINQRRLQSVVSS
jgi:hypothetical protein